MSSKEKFSKEITDFQRYGTYSYEYDEVGNVIFESSSSDFSKNYVAFPLSDFEYNHAKITSFYDPSFTEFIPLVNSDSVVSPEVEQIQSKLSAAEAKNTELTAQLEQLIVENETNSTQAEKLATKQVILELRKKLGEGRVESDFSDSFPYSPLRKTPSITTANT